MLHSVRVKLTTPQYMTSAIREAMRLWRAQLLGYALLIGARSYPSLYHQMVLLGDALHGHPVPLQTCPTESNSNRQDGGITFHDRASLAIFRRIK